MQGTILSVTLCLWAISVVHTLSHILRLIILHPLLNMKLQLQKFARTNILLHQRGISTEDAIGLIVNGYAKEVINKLPMEFAVEAQKLLQ